MGTSVHSGRILISTGVYDGTSDPVGGAISRDVVLNNLCHYADEDAQVRAAWSGSAITGATPYLEPRTSPISADVWYLICESQPFPISVRTSDPSSSGAASYRLRVRVAGTTTKGDSVTFRVMLAPPGQGTIHVNGTPGDHMHDASTTSSSPAWLSGVSQGPAADLTLIHVPSEYASAWTTTTPTLDDLGGDPVAVEQRLVCLYVYALTTNVASTARLYGLYAAEYIGTVP